MISKNGRSPVEPAAIASRVLAARSYKGLSKSYSRCISMVTERCGLEAIYEYPIQRKTCPLSPRAKPLGELPREFSRKSIRMKFVGVA